MTMTYGDLVAITHRGARYPEGSPERAAYFNAADRIVRELAEAKIAEARAERARQRASDERMTELVGYGAGCATSDPV